MNDISDLNNRPSLRAYLVYALAAAFLFYEMALQASPSVMTHSLMRDLSLDAAGLGVMASFYFYSYTFMQIPAGLLFDRYNARILITLAVFVCSLGAFFFGTTTTATLAASGRFLMGVGSSFAFISVLVIAARWFPVRYFAFLVGVAQLLAAVGAMGGEVPLAAAVTHFGWRQTITFLSLIGFVLTVLIWLVIRNQPKTTLNKVMPPVEGVVKSLQHIMGSSQTWWVALYAFCSWAPITAFAELWGVPYLMTVYHISNTLAATAIAMTWLGLGIASPILGWLSDRLGLRGALLGTCAGLGLITTVLILYIPYLPLSLMFVLLFGFGIATAGQILTFAIVKDNNKPSVTAAAMGFNNMAVVAGGALFQPLVGILLRQYWEGSMYNNVQVYSAHSYRIALIVIPLCFFIAWIVSAFFIKETYCKPKFTE
ncbi:MAG: MFS transporter [Gammaproteobacteria bacterium]|nr:MFS transporter [Gammaproteobacteria bacterium]